MELCAFVCLIFVCGVFPKGRTALVQTQQTVAAAAGGEAQLSCTLPEHTNVLQVTWQKILPDAKTNVASHNKDFGQTVNFGFEDKIEFKKAELQENSIVVKNVTEQDEGCYDCVFTTYPDGSLTGTTCLQLYELHEPVLQIRSSNSSEGPVVWYSTTGRPAPTVNLTVAGQNLSLSHHSLTTDGFTWIIVLCVCGFVCGFVAAVIVVLKKKKKHNRNSDLNQQL